MDTPLQKLLAAFALVFVAITLISTLVAIWAGGPVDNLLLFVDKLLSWKFVAGGLVFGGAQSIVRAWRGK